MLTAAWAAVLALPAARRLVTPRTVQNTTMSRVDVTIPAPDGDCAATLHLPEGSGPWPAVLMYTDAGGVRETFLAMADRIARSATPRCCRTSTTGTGTTGRSTWPQRSATRPSGSG